MSVIELLRNTEKTVVSSVQKAGRKLQKRLYEFAQYKDDLSRVLASGGHIDIESGDRPINPFITNPFTGKSLIHTVVETDNRAFARLFNAFKKNPNTLWYKVDIPTLFSYRDYKGTGPTLLQNLIDNDFVFNELDIERIAPLSLWQSKVVLKVGLELHKTHISLLEHAYTKGAISSKAYMNAVQKILGEEHELKSDLANTKIDIINKLNLMDGEALSDPQKLNEVVHEVKQAQVSRGGQRFQEVFERAVQKEAARRMQIDEKRVFAEQVLQFLEEKLKEKNMVEPGKSLLAEVRKQFLEAESQEQKRMNVANGRGMAL